MLPCIKELLNNGLIDIFSYKRAPMERHTKHFPDNDTVRNKMPKVVVADEIEYKNDSKMERTVKHVSFSLQAVQNSMKTKLHNDQRVNDINSGRFCANIHPNENIIAEEELQKEIMK